MIEVSAGKENGYVFRLKTESGQVLMNSVPFSSKNELQNTIRKLHTLHESQHAFERKTDHSGKFLFNMNTENGQLIGSSQLYGSEAGMENGIKNIKKRISYLSSKNQL